MDANVTETAGREEMNENTGSKGLLQSSVPEVLLQYSVLLLGSLLLFHRLTEWVLDEMCWMPRWMGPERKERSLR
jgi:hypothetical protein